MAPEERQLLSELFNRLRQTATTPREPEADALIENELRVQPHAPYFLAQAVIIQEKALEAATAKVRDLETQINALRAQAAPAGHDGASGNPSGGSFLGGLTSLFTGSSSAQGAIPASPAPASQAGGPWGSAPPASAFGQGARPYPEPGQPQGYGAPGYGGPSYGQTGPSAGGGFLRGALTTAAGVAGGVLVADAVRDIFSSHGGGFGQMLGANPAASMTGLGSMAGVGAMGAPGAETIVNNTYIINEDGGGQNDIAGTGDGRVDDGIEQADFDDGGSYDDAGDFGGDDSSSSA